MVESCLCKLHDTPSVIATVAAGRYFYGNIHRMKGFSLSMKYPANHKKSANGVGWNPAKGQVAAVGYLTESMHGAGSPQAQRIMISRLADLKGKQKKAKKLCGIVTESIS